MPPTLPTTEPRELIAGDTWEWTRAVSGYSAAAGDTIAYYFGGKSVLEWLEAWAVPNGTGWTISVPTAATTPLQPGLYTWFARVTSGGKAKTVATGIVTVRANPATATSTAFRFWEEEALEAVRARLKGDLTAGVANYMLYGRSVSRYSLEQLARYEVQLANRVEVLRGGGTPRVGRVSFTFGRPQ